MGSAVRPVPEPATAAGARETAGAARVANRTSAGDVTRAAAVHADGRRARPGDRTHTVQPGESLWAIARDMLGGHPTRAQVAREVHRLWMLNRDRIGTGDPDIVMPGTRLVLR